MKRLWHKSKHKLVFGIVFLFGLLFGIGLVLSTIITAKDDKMVPPTAPTPSPIQSEPTGSIPQQATMAGEIVCLPHRDTSGPQTLECAIGMKTADGKYYALDINAVSSQQPMFINGKKMRANGVLTPIENLSSDHWQKYNVQGIFSVTDSLQVLP